MSNGFSPVFCAKTASIVELFLPLNDLNVKSKRGVPLLEMCALPETFRGFVDFE